MKKYLILADGGSPHTLKWAKELKKYFNIYMISFNGISDSSYMCEVIKKIKFANNIITFPFGVGVLPQIVEQEKNYDYFFSNRALEENYNIDLVINIFAGIYEKNKEAKLFIANKGSKDNKLKKLAEKLKVKDNIEFLGFLSEQKQQYYYRKCGYYISVPKSDSTSVSLLEAMSYGCIPIVSNIPANTEWIEDKINGLYYERSKIPEFLCNAFRINREIIRERAIWSNNIKKFVKIILGE